MIPRRNEEQRLCNIFFFGRGWGGEGGEQISCIMGNAEVTNDHNLMEE